MIERIEESRARQAFKNLDITNSVVFALVMTRNPDLFRRVVSAAIGREVDEIEIVTTEKTIVAGLASKGVRLDATATSGGEVFDVEMQVGRTGHIARRTRYYHSMMDSELLKRGEDYSRLPEAYVIFIGTCGLLGDGFEPAPARTFEMTDAATGQPLGDGTKTVVLDASAWEQADGELREMLELVKEGADAASLDIEGGIAEALQGAVDRLKESEDDMGIMTAAEQIKRMEKEVVRMDEVIVQKDKVISRMDKQVVRQNKEIIDLRTHNEDQAQKLEKQASEISELKARLAEALAKSDQD